jgi:hypothetical protein
MGQLGADYVDNTSARTGDWAAIAVLSDATFSTLANSTYSKNGTVSPDLGAISVPKGMTIYGRFSAFALSAGIVIAYRATVS